MNEQKLLEQMIMKNAQELADSLKIKILDKLIEFSETRTPKGFILKEELIVIRDGVEEKRSKVKDEEMKAIASVIDNLVGRFGQEKDFEDKVEEKCEDGN